MDINTVYKNFQNNKVGKYGQASDMIPIIGPSGDWKRVTGKDAIIVSIKNLLMTPLGQYPFDPTYGSLLHKQLFELAIQPTFAQIRYEVKNRIEQFENRVSVESVELTWIKESKLCRVDVVLNIQDEVNKTKLSVDIQNYAKEMFTSLESTTAGSY